MIAIELPKIEYQSVTATRRLAVEFPYADPFAGVPFRQKNGPAIAIIGAAGTIGAGISAGGLLGGLMIAGGVFSLVGGLTGNETLSMIGMGFSLAAGIGGSFVNADTGAFANPFTDGNFAQSYTGKAFANIKADLGFGGSGGGAADTLGITGDSTIGNITDVIPDVSASNMTSELVAGAPSQGIDVLKASSLPGAAKSGGGMLSQLMNNQGALGAIGGMADNYMKQKEIEAAEPLRDAQISNYNANADATNAQTDLLQDRYNNMQNQPEVGLGVNPNAQVFGNQPGTAQGKIAVVMNGEVKYLTQQEYDAVRQAQQGSGGGGMLSAGAV